MQASLIFSLYIYVNASAFLFALFVGLQRFLCSGNNSHGGREKTAKKRLGSAAVEPVEERLEARETSSTSVLNRSEVVVVMSCRIF